MGPPATTRRINWITWQPTPYHNWFFENLARAPSVDLIVHYLKRVVPSHPWKTVAPAGYESRYCTLRIGLDWHLIWLAVVDRRSLFVVAGWNQATQVAILSIRRLLRRHYAIWTDTPKLTSERGPVFLWARARFLRWIFKGAHGVMGTGTRALSILGQMGAPQDRLVNLPFFPDLAALKRTPSDRRQAPDRFRIISVGYTNNKSKGHDLALRALAKVMRMGIGVPFEYAIAGTGPDAENLKQLARRLDLEQNVRFLGWLEPEDVRALYREAHVLLHPSPIDDPYPNAVLDAMAAGLVAFVSDACGPAHDRLSHGVNGFVHRAGDVDELAAQLAELLRHPWLIPEIGGKARETAEQWPVERGVETLRRLTESCVALSARR